MSKSIERLVLIDFIYARQGHITNGIGITVEFSGMHRAKVEYSVSIVKGKLFNKSDLYPYSMTQKGATVESSKEIIEQFLQALVLS